MYKVGFIGCGNMGGALLKRIVKNIGGENVCVCEKDLLKTKPFTDEGVTVLDIKDVVLNSKYVFFAVKPQVLKEVISSFSEVLENDCNTIFISMCAGININSVESFLKVNSKVIRIMPNLPCLVESGVILYTLNNNILENEKREFLSLLEGVGLVDSISEDKIDIASVVSGCGPAFVYMFIDAISKSATKFGLDSEKAILYTIKTLQGASKLASSSDENLETLISNVCSPKGTTIEGVESLKEDEFSKIIEKAIKKSYDRCIELSK